SSPNTSTTDGASFSASRTTGLLELVTIELPRLHGIGTERHCRACSPSGNRPLAPPTDLVARRILCCRLARAAATWRSGARGCRLPQRDDGTGSAARTHCPDAVEHSLGRSSATT